MHSGDNVLNVPMISRQVLFHLDSPYTGECWADFPLHSIVTTEQLRAGRDWHAVDDELKERGLARYGFADTDSEEDAIDRAQWRWEADGPHASWFAYLYGGPISV